MNINYDEISSPIQCQIIKRKSDNKLFVEIPFLALDVNQHPNPIHENATSLFAYVLRDNGSATAIFFSGEKDNPTIPYNNIERIDNEPQGQSTNNTELLNTTIEPCTEDDYKLIQEEEQGILDLIPTFPNEYNQVIAMLRTMVKVKLGVNKYYYYRDIRLPRVFREALMKHNLITSLEDADQFEQDNKIFYNMTDALPKPKDNTTKSTKQNIPKKPIKQKPIELIKTTPIPIESSTNIPSFSEDLVKFVQQGISEFKITGLKKAILLYMVNNNKNKGISFEKLTQVFKQFKDGRVITPDMIQSELDKLINDYGLMTLQEHNYYIFYQ